MERLAKLKIIFLIILSSFGLLYNYSFILFDHTLYKWETKNDKYFDEIHFKNLTVNELVNAIWHLNDSDQPNCTPYSNSLKTWKHQISESYHVDLVKNCSLFKSIWNFPDRPYSKEESEYPLAYVFMGHKNLAQSLRLFRAIYQPQNVYCVNWDNKSQPNYQSTMQQLSSCFPNVIVPKIRRIIEWCNYTLLQATMDCLKLLRFTPRPFKYAQILSWNDYPLKTNRELVQVMKILNGSIDISLYNPQHHTFFSYSNIQNPVLPGGLVLFKSSFAVTMPREFITFIFDNKLAQELYLWFNNSICTEEMYFSTLVHNNFIKAPGSFPGSCLQFYNNAPSKMFISRYQIWNGPDAHLCKGFFVRIFFNIRHDDTLLPS